MKTLFRILILAAMVPTGAFAQTSAFTYQGTLNQSGAPANGSFEMQFLLFDADTGGNQIGNTAVLSSVPVAGGLFHVSLDFGANAFDGGARWLEIQLRTQGSPDPFVTLDPRQTVGATPYALYAMTPAGPAGATGPQGPQGVAGPAGLTWRGNWDGTDSYAANDAVQSGGSAWIALRANQNIQPIAGADWSLLAMKGDAGTTGVQGPQGIQGVQGSAGAKGDPGLTFRGPWNFLLVYQTDDAVGSGGSTWIALRANVGVVPTAGEDWALLAQIGDMGPAGPQGAAGPQGVQGAAGPQGAKGDTGDTGPTGPQGTAGLTWRGTWDSVTSYVANDAVLANGSAWVALRANSNVTPIAGLDWSLLAMKGDTGATGVQGPQGVAGPQGAQGATGLQGVKGDTGDTGPAGPQGPQGATGATGVQGPAGLVWRGAWDSGTSYVASDAVFANGSAWIALRANNNVMPVAGADWSLLAMKGDIGATGAQGPQGATGPQGAAGAQGAPGATGPQGVTGPQGAQGTTGPQGAKGDTGDAGQTGPQGPQGATGATGATGAQGPAGLTWRSDWNSGTLYEANDAVQSGGSAWIALRPNANVTPVAGALWSLLAMKGDTGATGAQGAQGPTGPQGPQGATGPQGAQGEKGDKGDTGDTGPQGPTGATGATGATGPQGPQGPAATTNNVLFITSDSDTSEVDSMLQLGVDNTPIITLLQNGNVGIGKTNPVSILDIGGTLTASAFSGSGASLTSINAAQLTGNIPVSAIANGSITATQLSSEALGSATVGAGSVGVNELDTSVGNSSTSLTITNPTPQTGEQFGGSAAAAGNNQILIGAPGENTGQPGAGSAYLYDSDGTLVRTFNNPGAAAMDSFGYSVAGVGTDRVLIGAPFDDTGAMDSGSVYLHGTDGALQQTLSNPSAAVSDSFGEAVAAVGTDRLLIGAPGDSTGALGAGSAYLYNLSGTLLQTINNPTPFDLEGFGKSVTGVGSDRIVIGAPEEGSSVPGAGAVYVYDLNGALLQTITNPAPVVTGGFGSLVVAAGNNQILIGAPLNDTLSVPGGGVAYLYDLNGTLVTAFTNPVPDSAAQFGTMAVALGTDSVLIGAPMADDDSDGSGVAYLFQTDGTHLITINNPSSAVASSFGVAAATIGTDKAFIAARGDDTGANDAGVGHVIRFVSNTLRDLVAGTVVDGAITSEKISGVLNVTSIPGLAASKITTGIFADDRISANIARSANVWSRSGNSGTTAGAHFLGTTDDEGLEFKVNSRRAFRLDPGPSGSSDNVNITGGNAANSITNGVDSSVIAGGGGSSTNANEIFESFSFIGGGYDNSIGNGNTNFLDHAYAVISGGFRNTTTGQYASVSGGLDNTVAGTAATIGGGDGNVASAHRSTVGGGEDNQAIANRATVAGGRANIANGIECTVAGGIGNRASNSWSFVGGGRTNLATGSRATIAGGQANTASGVISFIGGGRNNVASATDSTIAGGDSNIASGVDSAVGGGYENQATGGNSVVSGGHDNIASGSFSAIGGGQNNEATGTEAAIAGGDDNVASGANSSIGGGLRNTTGGRYSAIPGGYYGATTNQGQMSYATGRFAANGDAQTSLYVSRETTTGSGFVIVTDGGVTDILEGETWAFSSLIVGRSNDGKSGGYKIEGVIENVSGAVSLIGAPVTTVLGEDNASWDVSVAAGDGADAASDQLEFRVDGAGDNVRWVITIRISQVSY